MEPATMSFGERIMGVLRLDPATFRDIEHDRDATWQAVAVVAAAAILSGIGASAMGEGERTNSLLGGGFAALIFWAIYTFFVYVVGTTILKGPQTSANFGQVLRPLGFSYAPTAIAVLAAIPVIGVLLVIVANGWSLVASIVAIREALEVSTGRAVAVAIVAFVAMVVVLLLLVTVLGLSLAGIAGLAGTGTS